MTECLALRYRLDVSVFPKKYLKFLPFVAAFVVLIIFNFRYDSGPSIEVRALDGWIKKLIAFQNEKGEFPSGVLVRLRSEAPDARFDWVVSSSSPETAERVLRLLELAREASPKALRIESVGEAELALPSSNEVLLVAHDSESSFEAKISRAEFESNIKLQNLAKVFELAELQNQNSILSKNSGN